MLTQLGFLWLILAAIATLSGGRVAQLLRSVGVFLTIGGIAVLAIYHLGKMLIPLSYTWMMIITVGSISLVCGNALLAGGVIRQFFSKDR